MESALLFLSTTPPLLISHTKLLILIHQLYEIKVHRGSNSDHTWTVQHRYSDFAALNSTLQVDSV